MIISDSKVMNNVINLGDKIHKLVLKKNWDSLAFCSAFLTVDGAYFLVDALKNIENQYSPEITVLVGVKNYFTSPKAMRILIDYFDNSKFDNYQILCPIESEYHVKCYLFLSGDENSMIIGSANLTSTGLSSKGEISIKVSDPLQIDGVVECINEYCISGKKWEKIIDEYELLYLKNMPKLISAKGNTIVSGLGKINKDQIIRRIAATMGMLESIDKEANARIVQAYKQAKEIYPRINKSNSIIHFYDLDEHADLKRNYPIGAWFDRPKNNNTNWEIGDSRIIAKVGGYAETSKDELVMFMEKGCIHYKVNKKILRKAEDIGLVEEEFTPNEEELKEYIDFVMKNR